MSGPRATVVGVGNEFRRDDGIGPALIAHLREQPLQDVVLTVVDGEPTQLLEVWSEAPLAVVVDAVLCHPSTPGRIHRTTVLADLPASPGLGTHGLGIPDAILLAAALDRAPERLVVLAVEAADLGFGLGLSPAVEAAIPELVRQVVAELGQPDPVQSVGTVPNPAPGH
jgi:hydrogenase maturation protease